MAIDVEFYGTRGISAYFWAKCGVSVYGIETDTALDAPTSFVAVMLND